MLPIWTTRATIRLDRKRAHLRLRTRVKLREIRLTQPRYYNGTLNFDLKLEDLPDQEGYLYSGDVCDEYVNDTLRISLDAVVGIQKKRKDDNSENPFLLVLWAWDTNFTLGPDDKTANYSEYQFFETYSEE